MNMYIYIYIYIHTYMCIYILSTYSTCFSELMIAAMVSWALLLSWEDWNNYLMLFNQIMT